ncbi:hypothetical protein N9597_00140 [Candidatus Marinimicrobia bacterium]|nr:hypothetical protein [Candidatus Neomarinimicrobiota bacterium]
MKKLLLILSLSFMLAGEMEVEGGLTVSGQVNASSFSGDGSALQNLPSLGGMKPERIYYYQITGGAVKNLTVPIDKYWIITSILPPQSSHVAIESDLGSIGYVGKNSSSGIATANIILLSGYNFDLVAAGYTTAINIYEYSISGSGADQGMDYVIP